MLTTCWENIRKKAPLVECFANIVTANACANLLLACGASPVMADDLEGAAEFTAIAGSLSLNIGTFTPTLQEAMTSALKIARTRNIPVVLDPVGVACAKSRRDLAELLLGQGVSIIRCNRSEANALLINEISNRGVDAAPKDEVTEENLPEARAATVALAKKYRCIAAVTGAIDLVASPDGACAVLRNGHKRMSAVTGSGCMLSALTAAAAAANPNQLFEATASTLVAFGIAGEIAAESLQPGEGCGTFAVRLLDAAGNMNGEMLRSRACYEIF